MAAAKSLKLSFPEERIALITIDVPDKGANVLSQHVIAELAELISELETRKDLLGLIFISGKPSGFVAGADIREFAASYDVGREQTMKVSSDGRNLFARFAQFPGVTVAAIDGICVGGGAELAIWCDRRILSSSPKTQFGFPEVKLGLFPGWGGTARTPRIIGLSNAIELITSGESIDSTRSLLLGLAADVVPTDQLLAAAIRLVKEEANTKSYLEDRQKWERPIVMSETELTFLGATASAYIQQQTKGNYPAPIAALELMIETSQLDVAAAANRETEQFAELFGTPINRSLINVFFLMDRNKKDLGISHDASTRAIRSLGVFGAGIMGSGIAAAGVKRGLTVTLTDTNPGQLGNGTKAILEEASFDRTLKGPDPKKMLELAANLNATITDAEFRRCDLVIEAIVENQQAKQSLYHRIEPLLPTDAILASNTSAISIDRLAAGLARPDRFCGIHFFNPVRKMPLVEVIRGSKTSDETIATAVQFVKAIGKSPIVVQDGPGFLVNRLLLPYMHEAIELLLEGASIAEIDSAAKHFGMPMGPITLYDVVGLDTAWHAGNVMVDAFPDRIVATPLLGALVKAGRLGQKSGAGFFAYPPNNKGSGNDNKKGVEDPAVIEMIRSMQRKSEKHSRETIISRLFLPMVVEAARILEEKKVRDVRDVDLGLIYGIGFPPFRGGLLFWADSQGIGRVIEELSQYEPLGARFAPTPMLSDLARSRRGFYDMSGRTSR